MILVSLDDLVKPNESVVLNKDINIPCIRGKCILYTHYKFCVQLAVCFPRQGSKQRGRIVIPLFCGTVIEPNFIFAYIYTKKSVLEIHIVSGLSRRVG